MNKVDWVSDENNILKWNGFSASVSLHHSRRLFWINGKASFLVLFQWLFLFSMGSEVKVSKNCQSVHSGFQTSHALSSISFNLNGFHDEKSNENTQIA